MGLKSKLCERASGGLFEVVVEVLYFIEAVDVPDAEEAALRLAMDKATQQGLFSVQKRKTKLVDQRSLSEKLDDIKREAEVAEQAKWN